MMRARETGAGMKANHVTSWWRRQNEAEDANGYWTNVHKDYDDELDNENEEMDGYG